MADRAFLLDTSALLGRLRARVIWEADEPTMLTAARLKAAQRLSLADAINAAFAIRTHATVVHEDPEYERLHGQVDMEALPYKGKAKTQGLHDSAVRTRSSSCRAGTR